MVNNAAMFSRVEVTTLSDEELVRGIVTNVKDSRLVDELWNRTNTAIAKAAKVASRKEELGLAMDDALSEAYVAAWKALPLYDASKGASLKTYLRTKIGYHFLEMGRKGAIQKVRTKPYGEECEEDDDGRPCYGASYGDVCKVVSKKYDHKYRERELVDAYSQVRSLVTVAKHRECLDLLMEAYSLGERKPVQYVADGLGCSRQQVYNILRQVKSQVPGSLAAEVKNIL
ncbi:RNA polymerase sigma factor, sigma-70 family [Fibrobacter sp. UWB7]|nr:RNA polymerase sigma factor, sigma-70 family [Fibrobacter sp. UWB7]